MKTIYTLIFSLFTVSLFATNYYVSALLGNDSSSGLSESKPFKTIQKAADVTQPGDVVNIMNGTYTNLDNEPGFMQSQVVFVKNSGTSDAWITFQALEGHKPKIKSLHVNGFRLTASKGLTTGTTLCYIRIKNLTIEGNANEYSLCEALNQPKSCNTPDGDLNYFYNASGIAIGSDDDYAQPGKTAHHFEIINCEIYNCTSAGVGAYNCDYVTIEGCKIYNNCSKTAHGASGIHIYNPRNCERIEALVKNFNIINNEIYNNRIEVPFFDGKKCHGYTDGNGIIIDDSYNDQTIKIPFYGSFLIEGNVIYENGGSGIALFQSENIEVRNNTTFKNCQLAPDDKNRAEFFVVKCNRVYVENNIFYARDGQSAYYKGSKVKKIFSNLNVFYNSNNRKKLKNSLKVEPVFVEINDSPKIQISCQDQKNNVIFEVIEKSIPKNLNLKDPLSNENKIGALK